MASFKILLFAFFLLFASCKGESPKTPPPSPPPPTQSLEGLRWDWMNIVYYDNGTFEPVLGFKVYASSQPLGAGNAVVVTDVGNVTEVRLNALGLSDGEWYLSVSAYDAKTETGRNEERCVRNNRGVYSRCL